jgi:BirA family biotin operon repressor/biotin-[acetyl-CoA-carboxylase] ligase
MENLFQIEQFDIKLDTDIIGRNFIYCDEIDSTNNYLNEPRTSKHPNGTVILAEYQTKGKGRQNREWQSQKGQNLTFSILINDHEFLPKNLNIINLSAALAVALTIEQHHGLKATLKWPNDVLINSKKTAGILLESVYEGLKPKRLIIGIGINVNQVMFSNKFNLPATSLKTEVGKIVNREIFLAEYLNTLEGILRKTIKNSKSVLEEWRLHCDMIGKRVTLAENDSIRDGIFEDINDEGFLLLKVKNKTEAIHFGDVSIR